MPPQSRGYGGPTLPRTLLDQVGTNNRQRSRPVGRSHGPTRKEKRKVERQQNRHTKTGRKPVVRGKFAKDHTSSEESEEDQDKDKAPTTRVKPNPKANEAITQAKAARENGTKAKGSELQEQRKSRTSAEDEEIAALEKKLGIKGNKKQSKAFEDDGLDDLLGGLEAGIDSEDDDKKRKRHEDETWLQSKRRRSGTEGTQSGAREDDVRMRELDDDDEISQDDSEDNEHGTVDEDTSTDGDDVNFSSFKPDAPTKRAKENPYIPPPSTEPSQVKYIPPSRRELPLNDAEIALKLRRQVQGLLNRLSESNITNIVDSVAKLYQSNSRNAVTSAVVDLLLQLICDSAFLNDPFIILHAGFVGAMFKITGPDFAAQLIEETVRRFDAFYEAAGVDGQGGKETVNIVSFITQLYNFQVVGSELVFDYIRVFLGNLSELHTELLLRVVRLSGHQLRQDDPTSLKDIVLMLQHTVSEIPEGELSVRTRFMIETINDLKNNRLKAGGAAASAATAEHSTRMKKILGALNNRTIKASEPLRVGLTDIRETDKKGKWWLIGASWKGETNGISSKPALSADPTGTAHSEDAHNDEDENEEDERPTTDIASLARANGMNTSVRRAIFVALLTANDYNDAYQRLQKLSLTRAQEVEIPRVILHCTSKERAYNPYYALIAKRLCGGGRKMRVAFRFAVWDSLRRMASAEDDEDNDTGGTQPPMSTSAIVQLAKLYAHLLAGGVIGLEEILKPLAEDLALGSLRGGQQVFLEVLLVSTILKSPSSAPASKSVAAKKEGKVDLVPLPTILATVVEAASLIAVGLRKFMNDVVERTDLVRHSKDKQRIKEGCKIARDVFSEISSSRLSQGKGLDEHDDSVDLTSGSE